MHCETFAPYTLQDYKYVVILSKYNHQWMLSRHKERSTWETQGGHIEKNESPMEAARRELYEESGAIKYILTPLCDYRVTHKKISASPLSSDSNGIAFYANIYQTGPLPQSEIAQIAYFDALPQNITYPLITPKLLNYCLEHIHRL